MFTLQNLSFTLHISYFYSDIRRMRHQRPKKFLRWSSEDFAYFVCFYSFLVRFKRQKTTVHYRATVRSEGPRAVGETLT